MKYIFIAFLFLSGCAVTPYNYGYQPYYTRPVVDYTYNYNPYPSRFGYTTPYYQPFGHHGFGHHHHDY
jgi:hypothetical protein